MTSTNFVDNRLQEEEQASLNITTSVRPAKYLQPGLAAQIEHPLRPDKPRGFVYDRYDTEFERNISFRVIEPEVDLEIFHAWQNDPLVARFWEMAETEDKLFKYLQDQQLDPHSIGLIGYIDGEAFGYVETYWCIEDRLGAYYDSDPYDRGWHGLTGSRKHLGRKNTLTWIKGLCHYLFMDSPNTVRLMGEPRADNLLLLRYTDQIPYRKICEFDFPHKRSALMQLERDSFFKMVQL